MSVNAALRFVRCDSVNIYQATAMFKFLHHCHTVDKEQNKVLASTSARSRFLL